MAANLFGFSTQAFERFVQATAVHVIGPGVVIFGNGPDGGREATFQGKIPYPSSAQGWTGYGIVQAKYKDKTEGTAKDQRWALHHLKGELDNFVQNKKRIRSPEYYIFATNVVLTPAGGSGGKDEADALIRKYYATLGLKDHAFWDYDQLVTYLDTFAGLRQRFGAYTTPGDVLAAMVASIKDASPDFQRIITSFIERELRADVDARLDQGGQHTDDRTPLASVFIDLPVATQPNQEPPEDKLVDGVLPTGFLVDSLVAGASSLDPCTLQENLLSADDGQRDEHPMPNRFVLIGGPGYGKSTLGQFLAQIHRAAILARTEAHTLLQPTRTIITGIQRCCEDSHIPWPSTPRYPVRFDLSAFARCLAPDNPDRVDTLAQYLVGRIRADKKMRVEDLFKWLEGYPWLLIMDGLDEVPVSSNRAAVCRAIQDFLAEATQRNADLLVVATTRPEGYGGELGEQGYVYRYLRPLSHRRALAYAKAFALTRYPEESPKVQETVSVLRDTLRDVLTARLMRTPLQVTFMATLVAAGGRPPRDRWKLFHEYYSTIYRREQQKSDGELQEVLTRQDALIHGVHHDTGFLLQVRGENTGSTDAMLPLQQFVSLIDRRLRDDEWSEAHAARIRDVIAGAARHRLVFLTSRVADSVSFDVRSLQEYMAAERLMTGAEEKVLARLHVLAAIPYWRNVVLFMIGKCFGVPQMEHLRTMVADLCAEMNEEAGAASETRAGSRLALRVIDDGAVLHSPKFAKVFLRIALGVLDVPRDEPRAWSGEESVQCCIARLYSPQYETIYAEAVTRRVGGGVKGNTLCAWGLLVELCGRGVEWACKLAREMWPKDPEEQMMVIGVAESGAAQLWTQQYLHQCVAQVPCLRVIRYACRTEKRSAEGPDWANALVNICANQYARFPAGTALLLHPDDRDALYLRTYAPLCAVSTSTQFLQAKDVPAPSPEWIPIVSAGRFVSGPCARSLGDELEYLTTTCSIGQLRDAASILPWPMGACIYYGSSVETVRVLADRARKGDLGDYAEWQRAEQRWQERGIVMADVVADVDPELPFSRDIASVGCVACGVLSVLGQGDYGGSVERCVEAFAICKSTNLRSVLADCVLIQLALWADHYRDPGACLPVLDRKKFVSIVESSTNEWWIQALDAFCWPEALDEEWVSTFDRLGRRMDALAGGSRGRSGGSICEQLAAAFALNSTRTGVLRILAGLSVLGHMPIVPERLLAVGRYTDARDAVAAILLRLRSPDIDPEEASVLAKEAVALSRTPHLSYVVEAALSVIAARGIFGSADERFLMDIAEGLTWHPEVEKSICIRQSLLGKVLSSRKSSVGVCEYALDLGLPWISSLGDKV